MIHDPFLRRVAISLSIFFVFGFAVSGLALIIKYKPYGVSDYERPKYEAKVKHIKEVEQAAKIAKETGLKSEFYCQEPRTTLDWLIHTLPSHIDSRSKTEAKLRYRSLLPTQAANAL